MDIHLISLIEDFNNYYLVISARNSDKTLSIIDSTLKIIKALKIPSILFWGAEFHISKTERKALISI